MSGVDRFAGAGRHRWSELPTDHPMAMLSRRRVIGELAMLSHVRLEKGCDVPRHAHANEQFTAVLSGRLQFGVGDDEASEEVFVAEAGEVVHLPPHLPHRALALADTVVLDVFSPPSAGTGIDG